MTRARPHGSPCGRLTSLHDAVLGFRVARLRPRRVGTTAMLIVPCGAVGAHTFPSRSDLRRVHERRTQRERRVRRLTVLLDLYEVRRERCCT